MKKEYTRPTAQVEEFDLKDVVMATSGGPNTNVKTVTSLHATSFDDALLVDN